MSILYLMHAAFYLSLKWGVTPLMFAAKEGHLGVVKALYLSEVKLDVNLQEDVTKQSLFLIYFDIIFCS